MGGEHVVPVQHHMFSIVVKGDCGGMVTCFPCASNGRNPSEQISAKSHEVAEALTAANIASTAETQAQGG